MLAAVIFSLVIDLSNVLSPDRLGVFVAARINGYQSLKANSSSTLQRLDCLRSSVNKERGDLEHIERAPLINRKLSLECCREAISTT